MHLKGNRGEFKAERAIRPLVTNAKTEGINNKIKTLKRQAYGYRDMEYFKITT